MATLHQDAVVLELAHIDELFKAPQIDPFSTREVAVFGEAGMERLRKRVVQRWPRQPRSARLILQLPPDRITPATAADARAALRRLSAAAIARNRLGRRKAIAAGLRQLVLACAIVVVVLPMLYLLAYQPAGVLPSFWRGIFGDPGAVYRPGRAVGCDPVACVRLDSVRAERGGLSVYRNAGGHGRGTRTAEPDR